MNELNRRLETIAELLRSGDIPHGSAELGELRKEIERLPPGDERERARARADVEQVRLHWLGIGVEPRFTLREALKSALATRAAVGTVTMPDLQAEIASLVAGIAYDLGDGESLERARGVLDESIAALLRADATSEPARLLDEEAAIELRLGHITRARELLDYARRTFETEVAGAPSAEARAELAATHHLIARLALRQHATETVETALEHARTAASEYRALGRTRDLGRVTETIARLERARGRYEESGAMFLVAIGLADRTTDPIGLARSTAGLASLIGEHGDVSGALRLLASSIELNRQKGSPGGLAFDERVLEAIERGKWSAAFTPALAEARARLERAIDAVM